MYFILSSIFEYTNLVPTSLYNYVFSFNAFLDSNETIDVSNCQMIPSWRYYLERKARDMCIYFYKIIKITQFHFFFKLKQYHKKKILTEHV